MSTSKYFNLIATIVIIIAMLGTVIFMNGEALGMTVIVDEDTEAHEGDANFTSNDQDADWADKATSTITLADDDTKITGNGAYYNDGTVTIKNAGYYIISGELTDGAIIVDTYTSSKVWIMFDGVTINCEDDACLQVDEADKVFLTLAEGSTNTLTSGAEYSEEAIEDGTGGTIYAHDDLTINGTGSLAIEASYQHGIEANDDLTITGGTITITAPQDGINVNESFHYKDAALTIESGDDGIHAGADVYIESGAINIDKCYEGIEGLTIEVAGGDVTVYAEDDGLNANGTIAGQIGNMGGGMGGNMQGGMGGPMGDQTMTDAQDASTGENTDGAAQSQDDTQTDGPTQSQDDTQTDGSAQSQDGTQTDGPTQSQDDTQTDGSAQSQEGPMFGGKGGGPRGSDDGNRPGPPDGEMPDMTGMPEMADGEMPTPPDDGEMPDMTGMPEMGDGEMQGGLQGVTTTEDTEETTTVTVEDTWIRITGGTVTVYNENGRDADGIDSNGNIYMEGGTLLVSVNGASSGNSAIDYNSECGAEFIITGGTIIACGGSSMAEAFSENDTQVGILYNMETTAAAGDAVTVMDADGNELVTWTPTYAYNSVAVSCPEMAVGETYTIKTGETTQEITADSTAVTYGSGGMGGMGGMGGPQGGMPGRMGNGTQGENSGTQDTATGDQTTTPATTEQPTTSSNDANATNSNNVNVSDNQNNTGNTTTTDASTDSTTTNDGA